MHVERAVNTDWPINPSVCACPPPICTSARAHVHTSKCILSVRYDF